MDSIPRTSGRNAGMPPELFDIYLRYKQDTRAVVAWFLSHRHTVAETGSPAHQLSVRDLARIGNKLCTISVVMPSTIAYQFKEMIRARYLMSRFFRKAESGGKGRWSAKATEDHEFFTMSLTKIYDDLCSCCKAKVEDCHCDESCGERDNSHLNKYVALNATAEDDCKLDDAENEELNGNNVDAGTITKSRQGGAHVEENEARQQSSGDARPPSPTLLGDDLGDTFDIWDQVQQMCDIFTEVETIWSSAARGSAHIITATAVTNAAFTRLESLEHHLIHTHSIKDPMALERATKALVHHVYPSLASNESPAANLITHLCASWQSMLDLRSQCSQDGFEARLREMRLPSSVTFSPGLGIGDAEVEHKDRKCRAMMLSNVALTVVNRHLHNVFVRGGSAGCAEVGFFMAQQKKLDAANNLHCCSALSLLLVSYKAFSFSLPEGKTPSVGRVQCLRFAQESVKWIDTVLADATMPCRCKGTLAFHLGNLKDDFASYIRTRLFDVYFQNPWICGGHVLEMMHALRYYGLRLLAYKSYVGSVVHVYNVLRQLGECEEIHVLEQMCTRFETLFFPGGRPDRAYKNSYVRYLGGRLRFHGSKHHQSGCHELAIPAHAARATAGFSTGGRGGERDSRFDCGRLSVLFRAKEEEFYLHNLSMDTRLPQQDESLPAHTKSSSSSLPIAPPSPLRTIGKSRRSSSSSNFSHARSDSNTSASSTTSTSPSMISSSCSNCSTTKLQCLQSQVETELADPSFPNARLNFFSFYLNCVAVVNDISDKYHDEGSKKGQYCLCFAENLIAAAEGGREGKGWRWARKDIRVLVGICRDVIIKSLGSLEVENVTFQQV